MINIKEIFRFGIVGVLATIIHYGVYLLLMKCMPINIAYTSGYLVAFCFNFILSANFTFNIRPTFKKGIGFGISHLINYGIHIVLLNFFLWMKLPANYVPIPIFLIAIPVNFVLVRFVFKSSNA